jgi:hypothetical protein
MSDEAFVLAKVADDNDDGIITKDEMKAGWTFGLTACKTFHRIHKNIADFLGPNGMSIQMFKQCLSRIAANAGPAPAAPWNRQAFKCDICLSKCNGCKGKKGKVCKGKECIKGCKGCKGKGCKGCKGKGCKGCKGKGCKGCKGKGCKGKGKGQGKFTCELCPTCCNNCRH